MVVECIFAPSDSKTKKYIIGTAQGVCLCYILHPYGLPK